MDQASSARPQARTQVAKPKTAAKDFFAGACAGAIAKTVVAPIERVKLLMQLQFSIDPSRKNKVECAPSRTSAWEVVKRVYREEGVLSFWRGECDVN